MFRFTRFMLTITAAALLASNSFAAPPARAKRPRLDLSGTWQFRFDPAGAGETQQWFLPLSQSALSQWQGARVPGSFNEQFAAHPLTPDPSDRPRFYKGAAWYRTSFRFMRDTRQQAFLHLSGTVLRQKVWVNGKSAGESSLPYLDVSYDVSGLLQSGDNTLVIEVDNRPAEHGIPDSRWRGWWDDGGLIRPVYIEERPRTRSDTHIVTTMLPAGRWQLQLQTETHQPAGAAIDYTLRDAAGSTVWRSRKTLTPSDADTVITAKLSAIAAWSPDHPALYLLSVVTSAPGQPADIDAFRIGFRQVETRGSQLLLNGAPLTIRGINRHEFLAGAGMSLTPAQNRADIADLKALGANFTRLAHYSQSAEVYDACDELGLLVWTEIPAWQTSTDTLKDPSLMPDYALPQLTAMVEQHRNHPSVIIYSVANEIPSDKVEGEAFLSKAIALVHHLDPTRLVTFASDKRDRDRSMASVDIVAVNEYFGWYYGGLQDVGPMLDDMHARYPGKPVLVSEYGSEAVAGWDPAAIRTDSKGVSKDYSTAFQSKLLAAHMKQIYDPARRGYVAGGVIWIYNDFPDPHRNGSDQPEAAKYRNNKGLVTMDRIHKPAYAVVQSFYRQLAVSTAESGSSEAPVSSR